MGGRAQIQGATLKLTLPARLDGPARDCLRRPIYVHFQTSREDGFGSSRASTDASYGPRALLSDPPTYRVPPQLVALAPLDNARAVDYRQLRFTQSFIDGFSGSTRLTLTPVSGGPLAVPLHIEVQRAP